MGSRWLWLWLAVLLLVLPLPWIAAAVAAALGHELGHMAAVWLCGGRLRGGSIGISGAVLRVSHMGYGRALICTLAGPAASLAMVLLYPWTPRIALCAMVQGFFNLLPCRPLDGGRALECIAGLCCRQPEKTAARWELGAMLALAVAALAATWVWRLGWYGIAGSLILAGNALARKNSLQS